MHCEKHGSLDQQWWRFDDKITESCYFSQFKCAKLHTNRLDFLVPIFFKTIKSFSSTFQGKFPIFKADWKIKHFSRKHSNSSTFQDLWEPCNWYYLWNSWLYTLRPTRLSLLLSTTLCLFSAKPLFESMNQWWIFVNWVLRNTFQLNFNQNINNFIKIKSI